jgi:hypothetical protein
VNRLVSYPPFISWVVWSKVLPLKKVSGMGRRFLNVPQLPAARLYSTIFPRSTNYEFKKKFAKKHERKPGGG